MEYPHFEAVGDGDESSKNSPSLEGNNWKEKMNQIPFFSREDGPWREEIIPRVNKLIEGAQQNFRESLSVHPPAPDFGRAFDTDSDLRRAVYERYLGQKWDQQLANAQGEAYQQAFSTIARNVFEVWDTFIKNGLPEKPRFN